MIAFRAASAAVSSPRGLGRRIRRPGHAVMRCGFMRARARLSSSIYPVDVCSSRRHVEISASAFLYWSCLQAVDHAYWDEPCRRFSFLGWSEATDNCSQPSDGASFRPTAGSGFARSATLLDYVGDITCSRRLADTRRPSNYDRMNRPP